MDKEQVSYALGDVLEDDLDLNFYDEQDFTFGPRSNCQFSEK